MNWQAYLGNLNTHTAETVVMRLQDFSSVCLLTGLRDVPPLEPEEPQSSSQAYFRLEHLSDGHACIDELLTPLITDAGHEGSWFADQTQLLQRKQTQVKQDS